MRRTIYTLIFIVTGLVVGKACQYTAIAWLQPGMGFQCASIVGLMPFVAALVLLKARYPRYFAFRRRIDDRRGD